MPKFTNRSRTPTKVIGKRNKPIKTNLKTDRGKSHIPTISTGGKISKSQTIRKSLSRQTINRINSRIISRKPVSQKSIIKTKRINNTNIKFSNYGISDRNPMND